MHIGKSIRMERIFNRNTGKSIVVPMDHGVSCGPIAGLQNLSKAVNEAAEGGANAVLGHKGLVRSGHRQGGRDIGLILHLSSSTDFSPSFNRKTLTATVEDAVKHGADAVSLHINLGDPNEAEMLSDFGKVSTEAENWGMPLLAMVYGRGPKIANGLAPEVVAHCARVGVELGADVVKVPYTGDVESFSRVVEGCCVPILLAGGPKTNSTHEFLTMVHEAMQAGAAGLSVGRNVFQHENPRLLLCVLSKIVHDKLSIEQALAATEGDLA